MSEITFSALIELAVDLASGLSSEDRFDRLLSTVRQTINCDAVVLLERRDQQLKPLAQQGLTSDSLGRRFDIDSNPRFAEICAVRSPVRFPADSGLPDPYDGMLLAHDGDFPVHACMGLPLLSDGGLIGVLTLDSMQPNVFDDIPQRTLDIISLIAAATLKTAMLLQQLETYSRHKQQVVEELTLEALNKDGGELVGTSASMLALRRDIELVAPSDFSVLIEGETGVGKELVARTIHLQSRRSQGPLVYVNCAAIPEDLIESELFGHVKGAFTGADKHRVGKFRLADEGTIFLDEIGELSLPAQSKLLRALQNQEIQPVGQDAVETINTRILAATNRQLRTEVDEGRFRADLFHRLSVYPIKVPPLREREGDVALLAGYFCEATRRKLGLRQLALSSDALTQLSHYQWPGNVRELEHVISRAALLAQRHFGSAIVKIKREHLAYLSNSGPSLGSVNEAQLLVGETGVTASLKRATEDFQRRVIRGALEKSEGNWSAAARHLQVDRANLNRMARRLGIVVEKIVGISNEGGG